MQCYKWQVAKILIDKEKLEQIALRCDLTREEKTALYEIASYKKLDEQLNDDEQLKLGKLFPMEIYEYQYVWYGRYQEEEKLLKKELGNIISEIHHFGSTSVVGLPAKPVIDILMIVKKGTNQQELKKSLKQLGYGVRICEIKEIKPDFPATLKIKARKGYTIAGQSGPLFHLHIFDIPLVDELIFKEALSNDEKLRREYANLKCKLKNINPHDQSLYHRGKTEFIKKVVENAKTKKISQELSKQSIK